MGDVVIANWSGHYGESGYLREGDIWAADDPVVKAHPDWFETDLLARALRSVPAPEPKATHHKKAADTDE